MPVTRVPTAAAMAEATTMMMIATINLGRNEITPVINSLIGFGPKTPKASCSTNSINV